MINVHRYISGNNLKQFYIVRPFLILYQHDIFSEHKLTRMTRGTGVKRQMRRRRDNSTGIKFLLIFEYSRSSSLESTIFVSLPVEKLESRCLEYGDFDGDSVV